MKQAILETLNLNCVQNIYALILLSKMQIGSKHDFFLYKFPYVSSRKQFFDVQTLTRPTGKTFQTLILYSTRFSFSFFTDTDLRRASIVLAFIALLLVGVLFIVELVLGMCYLCNDFATTKKGAIAYLVLGFTACELSCGGAQRGPLHTDV